LDSEIKKAEEYCTEILSIVKSFWICLIGILHSQRAMESRENVEYACLQHICSNDTVFRMFRKKNSGFMLTSSCLTHSARETHDR
jgi:hypothetical protein